MRRPSNRETQPLNVLRGNIVTVIQALVVYHAHLPKVADGLTDEVADCITAAKKLREIWFTDYD